MAKNETSYARLAFILSFGVIFKLVIFWLVRRWLRTAAESQ